MKTKIAISRRKRERIAINMEESDDSSSSRSSGEEKTESESSISELDRIFHEEMMSENVLGVVEDEEKKEKGNGEEEKESQETEDQGSGTHSSTGMTITSEAQPDTSRMNTTNSRNLSMTSSRTEQNPELFGEEIL